MAPRLFLAACVALCACIALSHAQQADPKSPVACQKRQERFVAYISGGVSVMIQIANTVACARAELSLSAAAFS